MPQLISPITMSVGFVYSILASIFQFILNTCAKIIDGAFNLIGALGLNTGMFKALFPDLVGNIYDNILVPVGIGISVLLLILGMIPFLFPFLNKNSLPAPSPFLLIVRFAISLVLVFTLTGAINNYIMPAATATFNSVFQIEVEQVSLSEKLETIKFDDLEDESTTVEFGDATVQNNNGKKKNSIFKIFGNAASAGSYLIWSSFALPQVVVFIFLLILVIYLVITMCKFIMFHFEKFVTVAILVYTAPIVASSFTLKNTSSVVANYFKLLLSNLFCLVFNVLCLKLTQSIAYNGIAAGQAQTIASGGTASAGSTNSTLYLSLLISIPLMCATLNVGKKMAVYIAQLLGTNGMADAMRNGVGGLASTAIALGGLGYQGFRMGKGAVSSIKDQRARNAREAAYQNKLDGAPKDIRDNPDLNNKKLPLDQREKNLDNALKARERADAMAAERERKQGMLDKELEGKNQEIQDAMNAWREENPEATPEEQRAAMRDLESASREATSRDILNDKISDAPEEVQQEMAEFSAKYPNASVSEVSSHLGSSMANYNRDNTPHNRGLVDYAKSKIETSKSPNFQSVVSTAVENKDYATIERVKELKGQNLSDGKIAKTIMNEQKHK